MERRYLEKKKHINMLIVMCWLCYTIATFARMSYNVNIVDITASFGTTNAEAGLVSTCFAVLYGIGQLVNGAVVGKIPPRKMILIGLGGSSILTAILPIVPFEAYKFIWALNGAVQSLLWSNIVQIFADMLPGKAISRAVLVIGFTTATGTVVSYGASAVCTAIGSWQAVFYLAGGTLFTVTVLWHVVTSRLAQIQKNCPVYEGEVEEGAAVRGKSWVKILSYTMGILLLASFFCNFSRSIYNDWAPSVLTDTFRVDSSVSKAISIIVPIIAIFGSMAARALHKRLGNPFLSLFITFVTSTVLVGLLLPLYDKALILTAVMFALIAFVITATNVTVTSLVPLALRNHGTSGRIAGVLNCCCHLGDAVAGVTLGHVADVFSWTGVFTTVCVACAVVTALCFIGSLYWKTRIQPSIHLD